VVCLYVCLEPKPSTARALSVFCDGMKVCEGGRKHRLFDAEVGFGALSLRLFGMRFPAFVLDEDGAGTGEVMDGIKMGCWRRVGRGDGGSGVVTRSQKSVWEMRWGRELEAELFGFCSSGGL
jgi:hypothetical protein